MDSPDLTPVKSKKKCLISTPEAIKVLHNKVSAPFTAPAIVKVCGVPHPFMEKSFTSRLEKLRKQAHIAEDKEKTIERCFNYNKREKSVCVEFISQEIADEVSKIRNPHFLNCTVTFENFQSLDISSIEQSSNKPPKKSLLKEIGFNSPPTAPPGTCSPLTGSGSPTALTGLLGSPSALTDSSPTSEPKCLIYNEVTLPPSDSFDDCFMLPPNEAEFSKASSSSTTIKVDCLPVGFNPSVLLYVLNNALMIAKYSAKYENHAITCNESGPTSACVEFSTTEAAIKCCELKVQLEGQSLMLSVKEKIPTSTKFVDIIGLPTGFVPSVLLYVLNNELLHSKFSSKYENHALKCQENGPNSACVEFTSTEAATECCKLELQYEGKVIVPLQQMETSEVPVSSGSHVASLSTGFKKVHLSDQRDHQVHLSDQREQEGISDEEDFESSMLKSSKFVKVTNLPTLSIALDKDKLIQFLNQKMQRANFVIGEENCVQKCDLKPSEHFAIVEFRNCEEANLATLLENVKYFQQKLTITKYAHDTDNNVVESEPSEASSNLNVFDGEGALIFSRLLIKHRDSFPKCGSHDRILETIRAQLLHHGVRATLADVRSKRERLKELFRRKKVKGLIDHPFYEVGQVMFERGDLAIISGTSYDPSLLGDTPDDQTEDNEHDKNVLKFSKVASWTTRASLALIEKVSDTQNEYYKPQRRANYWETISSMLAAEKYFYFASQCESRVERLKCVYKNYKQEYDRGTRSAGPMFSGEEKPMRELMVAVGNLLKGSVSVDPEYTVAVGVKVQEKHCDQSATLQRRGGKERPNVMKRKVSLKERKLKVDKMKAKALLLISKKYAGVADTDLESDSDPDDPPSE